MSRRILCIRYACAWIAVTAAGAGGAIWPLAAQPADGAAAPIAAAAPGPYVRVVDADDGTIQLQVAVRTLNPPRAEDGSQGPTVYLSGAVHVADAPFYDDLQAFLDSRDVVLFEGVKPSGAGRADVAVSDEQRVTQTEHRLRFLAAAAAVYRTEHGAPPASVDELAAGMDKRLAGLVASSREDAWGNAIRVSALPEQRSKRAPGVDFVSTGADGRPGGDGPDADLRFSDQKPLSAAERGEGDPGIQTQLADALGLVFQKDGMDWTKPNWRNSDLSVDEIMDRLDRGGGGGEALFDMLGGGSFMGKLAGFVLKLIGMSPTSQTMAKMFVAEMLGQADELLKSAPGMDGMVDVIIGDRNAVVVDDLRRLIREEPEVRTVGIIYGAGHLQDMEKRICSELGYTPGETMWRAAITVDLAKAGLTAEEAKPMREMIRKAIRDQIAAAKKTNKKK